jgi:hypothetical protein
LKNTLLKLYNKKEIIITKTIVVNNNNKIQDLLIIKETIINKNKDINKIIIINKIIVKIKIITNNNNNKTKFNKLKFHKILKLVLPKKPEDHYSLIETNND